MKPKTMRIDTDLKAFADNLYTVLEYWRDRTELGPDILEADFEITQFLDRLQRVLRPIRNKMHKELRPEEYDY
jgi:hypothetical protein